MDAHKIILTTLTKRQLSELKKRYRKESQRTYGMNHSPDPEESLEKFILFLANLLFLGFTFTWTMVIVIACVTFSQAGFIVAGVTLIISLCFVLISVVIIKLKIKLSFATVISLFIIYWKAKVYKISMPAIN
ncbi:MAG TPA: hypothetical protein VJS14_06145 [Enterobacteriaceae bacterium]|nr:hypothetical protein [Enterobacteriaceae bacterium]